MQTESIVRAFKVKGDPISCKPFGSGHINHTLKIETDAGAEYVLQRINSKTKAKPNDVQKKLLPKFNGCSV